MVFAEEIVLTFTCSYAIYTYVHVLFVILVVKVLWVLCDIEQVELVQLITVRCENQQLFVVM